MVMVYQPAARRPHRSVIVYAFGVLALVGAATTLVVVIRDPALSSTRLTTPVPAPEITVVDPDQPSEDGVWDGSDSLDDPFAVDGPGDADADADADEEVGPASPGADARADAPAGTREAARHSPEDVSRSLFWSGIFGLAISLAGLGLVGTRRRMW